MKKVIVVIALFVGFMGYSQEEKSAYQADALQLVKLRSEGQFEKMLERYKGMIPEENQEAFIKEVKASLPGLYEKLSKVYMETYSHEEITKILDFYESPIGQKVVENTPKITKKSMKIGQAWGMKLRSLLTKYTK